MGRLIKGLAFDGQVRVLAVDSTDIVSKALEIHGLSPTATGALGRFLTAGALMGAMLKNDTDKLTLMMNGGGPLGKMVVCSDKTATVKGYVQNPLVDIPLNNKGKLDVGGAIGTNGMMTVIKDIGLKEPYSGSVEIVSGEIGDEFAKYFMESEQTPSAVAVGVLVNNQGEVPFAGGYIVQLMPNVEDAIVDMIEERVSHMKPVTTLLKEGFTLEEIVKAVTGDEEIKILEEINSEYKCDCSRERMERAIKALPAQEKMDIIVKEGKIEIKCSFCGRVEVWK
ncbi:MAG: Hsp33 family molecular chaperone HslO [Clostridiales bacterium]|nr:Hsp33 family molecular chaperone HslO [Clostridiales bacterium]